MYATLIKYLRQLRVPRYATDSAGNVTGLVGAGGIEYPLTPPSYLWANRPDATTADSDVVIRITDVGTSAFGSLWYTDGTRWRPVGDVLVLANVANAGVTNGTSTEAVALAVALPAGLLQDGDELVVAPYAYKAGGTSDTGILVARHGTSDTTLGTSLLSVSQPATTNKRAETTFKFRRASATALSYACVGGAQGGGGTSTTDQADVTVSDMDAGTTYLQLSMKLTTGGTETLTLKSCPVILRTY